MRKIIRQSINKSSKWKYNEENQGKYNFKIKPPTGVKLIFKGIHSLMKNNTSTSKYTSFRNIYHGHVSSTEIFKILWKEPVVFT